MVGDAIPGLGLNVLTSKTTGGWDGNGHSCGLAPGEPTRHPPALPVLADCSHAPLRHQLPGCAALWAVWVSHHPQDSHSPSPQECVLEPGFRVHTRMEASG